MIAYVFWHWKKSEVPAQEYERRQRDFHAALAASPPAGFISSYCASIPGLPWTESASAYDALGERVLAYEDWYLVEGFGALGSLNEGAVSGSRLKPHDAAAAAAEDGAGALYALRHGEALSARKHASWFSKPSGMSYGDCFAQLLQPIVYAGGTLWVRQMALGPAHELCVLSEKPLSLPPAFDVIQRPMRQVWPSP